MTNDMTKEEAIANLNIISAFFVEPVTKEQRKLIDDTFEMAIQALSQEPCDDAISRKELLKAIDTWDKFGCDADTKLVRYQDHYVPYIHYDDVIKCIKGMPSVTQKLIECDDVISREDAIKAQCESCDICGNARYTKCQYFMQGCNEVKCLRDLPSITQKPIECEDAVSREAVLEIQVKYAEYMGATKYWQMRDDIRALPSVTQKSVKWIPVSERLPEDGTYLVTLERFYGGEPRIGIRSFAGDLNKVDEFDFPKQKWGWYDYDSEYGYWEDTSVIAWMPLPEPYEPQESENK